MKKIISHKRLGELMVGSISGCLAARHTNPINTIKDYFDANPESATEQFFYDFMILCYPYSFVGGKEKMWKEFLDKWGKYEFE